MGQGEQAADTDHPPVAPPSRRRLSRRSGCCTLRRRFVGFLNAGPEQRDGEQAGDHGDPEDRPKIVGLQHQPGGKQRPTKAPTVSSDWRRRPPRAPAAARDVGDQAKIRRARARPADAVEQPRGEDDAGADASAKTGLVSAQRAADDRQPCACRDSR